MSNFAASLIRAAVVATLAIGAGAAQAAGPTVSTAPGINPQCYKPWTADTKTFQYPAKAGPYRIAFVNGFVGNTWRIQMIKTVKAYAEVPEVAKDLKEFRVISVGNDAAAQLGAIEDFINQGFDAITIEAVSTAGFDRVIRLANQKGVVLVAFDNVPDSNDVIKVNEDQHAIGQLGGEWLLKNVGDHGRILEVHGVAGSPVDRDRHQGLRDAVKSANYEWVEVYGNWDVGTSQKVVADALAVHGHFDGIFAQAGTNGTVQALIDAHHPFVPMYGEDENLFRKQVYDNRKEGLKAESYGQSPSLSAIALKAAIDALKGNAIPQNISVPIPVADYTQLTPGKNFWPELTVDFFASNDFPPCGVSFTAPQIMAHSAENK
jgi:ribose transport system substrate-binding protein